MRAGEVLINGIDAGLLIETDEGKYIFKYYKDYLKSPLVQPVSLTMPLQEEAYNSDTLFPFFFNMLSEGENREAQSRLLGIPVEDDFGFLLATCSYDTIGNVTVIPTEL